MSHWVIIDEFDFSPWTTEKRWVRAGKHCELERERSLVSDAVSLERLESKSIKLAMLASGLGGNVVTTLFSPPSFCYCSVACIKSFSLEVNA